MGYHVKQFMVKFCTKKSNDKIFFPYMYDANSSSKNRVWWITINIFRSKWH